MRTAWKSRAKSGGPVRAPSAPRIAPTRSSLVWKERFARRRTISRASRPARGSSPYVAEDAGELLVARRAEQLRGARRASPTPPMRMSSGAPSLNEKPRDASSI
jgi:hypothetical protein